MKRAPDDFDATQRAAVYRAIERRRDVRAAFCLARNAS